MNRFPQKKVAETFWLKSDTERVTTFLINVKQKIIVVNYSLLFGNQFPRRRLIDNWLEASVRWITEATYIMIINAILVFVHPYEIPILSLPISPTSLISHDSCLLRIPYWAIRFIRRTPFTNPNIWTAGSLHLTLYGYFCVIPIPQCEYVLLHFCFAYDTKRMSVTCGLRKPDPASCIFQWHLSF